MAKTTDSKKSLSKKLLEFQRKGWIRYGKYLNEQSKIAAGKKRYSQYAKYIEQQIAMKDKKIKAIESKLKKA